MCSIILNSSKFVLKLKNKNKNYYIKMDTEIVFTIIFHNNNEFTHHCSIKTKETLREKYLQT